jgi:hypothetical protein
MEQFQRSAAGNGFAHFPMIFQLLLTDNRQSNLVVINLVLGPIFPASGLLLRKMVWVQTS